ncbi:MAG: lipopolysaccharide heptosyltransferase I [Pseudomonadales bacterium]
MRVLLVKMSSLGDVVHTLPGVSDARAALGADGVVFDWVVEEAFADIPARHPGVDRVLPIAWRRWRRDLRGSRGELAGFLRRLRERRYDLILDAQGLLKSAAVCALARGGERSGLSRRSAREGAAAWFYRRRVEVPRGWHAVDRIRSLFAGALDYPVPDGPPDFGIGGGATNPGRRALLLHGTTWPSKHWPERFWHDLAGRAAAAGFEVLVPWGDAPEAERAQRIVADSTARVLERQPLAALIDELAGARLLVGADSGLAHLGAALGVPTVVIYGSTDSGLTGCRGPRVRNLQTRFPCSPCLGRACGYRGPAQHALGAAVEPACYSTLPPDAVWRAAEELLHADRVLHL